MMKWDSKGPLFRHAVSEAKFAMETSELIAIYGIRGKATAAAEDIKNYYQKLSTLVTSLRKELDVPEVPLLSAV